MEKTNEAEINGKGGGQTMVEETIRTIRETERQAQKIVEDAQAERERILAEAKERSGQIRDEILDFWREVIHFFAPPSTCDDGSSASASDDQPLGVASLEAWSCRMQSQSSEHPALT